MDNADVPTRHLWFPNTRVEVLISYEEAANQVSSLENWAPYGDPPPLHLHHDQDEVFHILKGDLQFLIGGNGLRAGAGGSLVAPKGVPHTYHIE